MIADNIYRVDSLNIEKYIKAIENATNEHNIAPLLQELKNAKARRLKLLGSE